MEQHAFHRRFRSVAVIAAVAATGGWLAGRRQRLGGSPPWIRRLGALAVIRSRLSLVERVGRSEHRLMERRLETMTAPGSTTAEATDELVGREFYDRHVQYLLDRDTDRLIDEHYNEEATLVSHDGIVRGREALKQHFRGYLEMLGELEVVSTDKFTDTGDSILFEATVNSRFGQARVYDAFVLRDLKIDYHFTGVM